MSDRIGVLIVDDSAVARATLTDLLESDPEIEVIATAGDPYIAARKMLERTPDVVVLDVEMPKMDGLTFLRKIMSQHPLPVIVCSVLTEAGTQETLDALEYGAVDIIAKPRVGTSRSLDESRIQLCDAVKAASRVRLRRLSPPHPDRLPVHTADAVLPRLEKARSRSRLACARQILAIGASTGGTEAIRSVLQELPTGDFAVLVVQHMPEGFTAAFAHRLDALCDFSVKEAVDGDEVAFGSVLIAPGNRHMTLVRRGAGYAVHVCDGPFVCRHRPSVDVLFRSVAAVAGPSAVGVLMTGMGDDGARGLLEMRQAGARTVAQDEASSVVWGMPHEAIKREAADTVASLEEIPAVAAFLLGTV